MRWPAPSPNELALVIARDLEPVQVRFGQDGFAHLIVGDLHPAGHGIAACADPAEVHVGRQGTGGRQGRD
jgi:hypothetical protein